MIPETATPGIVPDTTAAPVLSDNFTKEAIYNQQTAPYDTTAYGADVVNEYTRPVKVSDPYDLIDTVESIYATQY